MKVTSVVDYVVVALVFVLLFSVVRTVCVVVCGS